VKPEEKGPYICCEKIGLFEESSQHQKLFKSSLITMMMIYQTCILV